MNPKGKKKAQRNRKKVKPNGRSLFSFGFQIVKPLVKVSNTDSPSETLEEFSGVRVSTAP